MEDLNQKKLSFSTKFFYGFGSISFGIKNNGFSYFVLFVYTTAFGLEPWMAGVALNIILVADAITDPLVGYYSDRLRSIITWWYGITINFTFSVKEHALVWQKVGIVAKRTYES